MRTYRIDAQWLTETDLGEVRLATAEEIRMARSAQARSWAPFYLNDAELDAELERRGYRKPAPPEEKAGNVHWAALKDALRGIWDMIRGRR